MEPDYSTPTVLLLQMVWNWCTYIVKFSTQNETILGIVWKGYVDCSNANHSDLSEQPKWFGETFSSPRQ